MTLFCGWFSFNRSLALWFSFRFLNKSFLLLNNFIHFFELFLTFHNHFLLLFELFFNQLDKLNLTLLWFLAELNQLLIEITGILIHFYLWHRSLPLFSSFNLIIFIIKCFTVMPFCLWLTSFGLNNNLFLILFCWVLFFLLGFFNYIIFWF